MFFVNILAIRHMDLVTSQAWLLESAELVEKKQHYSDPNKAIGVVQQQIDPGHDECITFFLCLKHHIIFLRFCNGSINEFQFILSFQHAKYRIVPAKIICTVKNNQNNRSSRILT
ncbi:uncharacterized protein LOC107642163 [Arachis ipaensis]|uniref:uncharacterized protein LOC107642163 n=1 Tax=Arachis ipaensis TaxID=130454 RepID=UPI000A2B2377|nr:uncharacterized protein LOC107642163 [Arachis ipaensis]XP_025656351.1 uncharacterized protein LOC112751423 [Arachis hypogaea]